MLVSASIDEAAKLARHDVEVDADLLGNDWFPRHVVESIELDSTKDAICTWLSMGVGHRVGRLERLAVPSQFRAWIILLHLGEWGGRLKLKDAPFDLAQIPQFNRRNEALSDPSRSADSSQPKSELLTAIESQIALTTTPIRLGGRSFDWYRVANGDELLTLAALASEESEAGGEVAELDPFWAATWRAALGLDQFLGTINIAGWEILELGCGSGQAGVGAAVRGASVTMTDVVKLALQVAELNAHAVAQCVRFQILHWESGNLGRQFPIVIGSDLVYDTSLFVSLENCARRHLAPSGTLLLSEPHRHTGDAFASFIRSAGWAVTEHDVDLADGRVPIRVFECKLRA